MFAFYIEEYACTKFVTENDKIKTREGMRKRLKGDNEMAIASVIIPVYNAEKTVDKCVESLVYGKLKNIEIILIEDCSKDNSWAACQKLSTKYENVHSYRNEKNSGVSYTRNHGLSKAKGEYILFVDSDDWVSGKYAITLLETAKRYPDALVICGLHFHDEMAGERRDYLWEEKGKSLYAVEQTQFFELPKRFHLQQLWNKIFRRSIIEEFQIRFDETQNMGEDFEFVLDYMKATECKKCMVINEALYYYIRANNSSLMSQFGLIENGNEYKRLKKLLEISGADIPKVQRQYQEAIRDKRLSYVYFISRAKNKTKAEKLKLIENVIQDGQAKKQYQKQRIILVKENMFLYCTYLKKLIERVKWKMQRQKNNVLIKRMRNKFKNKSVSIISQNCIGGVFYHDMKKKFLSPTVNLYFTCPDFVKFVLNLKYYMESELQMIWGEEYPIGMLGDIRVYFMHYQTCTEAKEAWERRKGRINWDNILILSTDMEEFSEETFEQWKQIKYSKILFTAKDWNDESCLVFPQYKELGKVDDLIKKRKFYKDNILLQKIDINI